MSTPQDSNASSGADPHAGDAASGQRSSGSPTWGGSPVGGWGAPFEPELNAGKTNGHAPWHSPTTAPGSTAPGAAPAPPASPPPPAPAQQQPAWVPPHHPAAPAFGPAGPSTAVGASSGPAAGPGGAAGQPNPFPPRGWPPPANQGPEAGYNMWAAAAGYPKLRPLPQRPTRSPARLILAGLVALGIIGFAITAFVTPGFLVTRVFDATAVEAGVQRIMSTEYGIEGNIAVECPEGIEVTDGATFTCTATVDGNALSVPIRVTSADGDYEVGRPG